MAGQVACVDQSGPGISLRGKRDSCCSPSSISIRGLGFKTSARIGPMRCIGEDKSSSIRGLGLKASAGIGPLRCSGQDGSSSNGRVSSLNPASLPSSASSFFSPRIHSLRHLTSAAELARRGSRRRSFFSVSCSSLSLSQKFEELKQKNEVALIPFIVGGDPDLATTEKALKALTDAGADIIELGVPYSDPLADGPVIQAASSRALSRKTDLQSVLDVLKRASPSLSAPVVLFTYFNPIMKRGLETFMRDAKAAGAAGLVVPDVPLEETGPLRDAATRNGLELVLLTTPTTPQQRMHSIADATQGFLYLVSLTGVTGERKAVQGRVQSLLEDIKKATRMPVAVGFGISTPEHVQQVVSWGADGVIVGSALVRLLSEASSGDVGIAQVVALMKALKVHCKAQAVAIGK